MAPAARERAARSEDPAGSLTSEKPWSAGVSMGIKNLPVLSCDRNTRLLHDKKHAIVSQFWLSRKLRDFGFFHFFEQSQDYIFGGHPLRLRLKIRAEAVAEDGDGDFFDIVDGDGEAA